MISEKLYFYAEHDIFLWLNFKWNMYISYTSLSWLLYFILMHIIVIITLQNLIILITFTSMNAVLERYNKSKGEYQQPQNPASELKVYSIMLTSTLILCKCSTINGASFETICKCAAKLQSWKHNEKILGLILSTFLFLDK